ncbi:MAG: hypothetical protein JKY65_23480 [Planctomycetes bacterium]|nr:hypothetical protein [Planctomycetota bacterium]
MTTDQVPSEPAPTEPDPELAAQAEPEAAASPPEPVVDTPPEPVVASPPEPAVDAPSEPVVDAPPKFTEDQTSGRLFRRWNGGVLVLAALVLAGAAFMTRGGATPPANSAAPFDPLRFLNHKRWDQGRAEVARYEARRTLYSKPQTYELIRIAVKERFDPAQGVKGEAPGALDAIKTIAVHDTPTHRAYRYRQQVVVQMPRHDPRQVLASSMSSQEWCGSTFVRLRATPEGLKRTVHSYFQGEGDTEDLVPLGAVLADQVPFLVRAVDWGKTPTLRLALLPTLLSNRGPLSRVQAATLERVGQEQIEVPAGTYTCTHVRVLRSTSSGEAVDHYWVGTGPGRPLVKFLDATGEGQLSSLEWEAYWEDASGDDE